MLLDGWGNAVPHEEFSGIPHGMLAERDRLRKQEERKVSLVFGLKKGKVNILHPQPRHPCLEGDKAVDCLALFCYTIGAGKPASFKRWGLTVH